MAKDTRQRMIGAASSLLRERGYNGTGFRDVVAASGAAQGAIYHHFPGGKQQLGEEVVAFMGAAIGDHVDQICAINPPRQAVEEILDLAHRVLIRGEIVPGCSIAAVALAADDPDGVLRAAADGVFTRWRDALTECLERAGVRSDQAVGYAATTMAGIEGAVILCRARGDDSPFADARAGLLDYLKAIDTEA